jgi:hypothetical protein
MSAYSEGNYRELIEGARDAVHELLVGAPPDSWMGLRRNYTELRRIIELDDQAIKARSRTETTPSAHQARRNRLDELESVWREMPMERRESFLFQALRDERLTLREITARLNVVLDAPEGEFIVYQSNVRSLVMRMLRAGQLERVAETFKNKTRFRYFRKRGLDGPIVDLERAFHDDERGGER